MFYTLEKRIAGSCALSFQALFRGTGRAICMAVFLILLPWFAMAFGGEAACRHDLKVELQPEAHRLIGRDDIQIEGWKGAELSLVLSDKADIRQVLVNGKPSKYSFNSGKLKLSGLSAADAPLSLSISYDAVFNDPVVSEPAALENPGFGITGAIGERGVFLLESSGWYPGIAGCSEAFTVKVIAPRGIYAITAGELLGHVDSGEVSISSWKTSPIGQGISLSAGRYTVRSKKDGKVPVYTYFTEENDSLSQTYLKAAASHIQFYENLHGSYPFPKFAIVENFFPTGYGFPSYTLLGGTVIRLPFIPQTSLRHEIAHSWWGNGVLVDYASGNWCEGLTTYVADYLSREISSAEDARLYRRQILEEYATLAASGGDLPLRLFGSRSSPATRAVGYGKAAFVFHMIRQKLGDRVFWDCLRQIYKERLFAKASWDDFRDIFVRQGGWDAAEAKVFFDQWITRSGAPVLRLQNVQSRLGETNSSGWQTTGSVVQTAPWYDLDITIRLNISPGNRAETKIRVKDGSAVFSIRSDKSPQKLIADPDVNIFRLLYPEEIPATVNSVKGSHNVLAVLTKDDRQKTGGGERRAAFELLLEGLEHADAPIKGEKEAEAHLDKESDFLFFGLPRSEKLKYLIESAPDEVKRQIKEQGKLKTEEGSGADCVFLVFKDPNRQNRITALFLPAAGASADSVLAAVRKITHYGKFSYLAFSHGTIQEKEEWDNSRSPLNFYF
jgi:hypothetical protein